MTTEMEGYKRNALGHLVPLDQIKEIDKLRDEFVRAVVERAKEQMADLAAFKRALIGDMASFLDLSAERYGVKIGGEKGNIQISSFDGKYRISKDVAERIEFDERLQAAKALIDECLREWTKYSPSEIRALIDQAFQVDQKGRINTKRILALRKLEIDHPTWKTAMEAIGDAITVTGSAEYYRFYERDEQGKYQQIPLDFAVV